MVEIIDLWIMEITWSFHLNEMDSHAMICYDMIDEILVHIGQVVLYVSCT